MFKETMDVCLRVVFELAVIAIAKPLLGDEGDVQSWKASWIADFATYAIVCHSIKICVGMKRDQVALTNNTEVCAFILKHILQFLIPLSHSSLAYAYLMGLDTKNHHMENNWKMVAFGIRIFTLVVGSLLALMGACKIFYSAANDRNQIIAVQTNVENQTVANVTQSNVENQTVANVTQSDVENQSFAPEEIQLDVDDQSYPDACLSHWDVETQLLADANLSVESRRDEENQSFAQDEKRLDVEDHSYPDACLSDWLECVAENPSLEDANVSKESQRDEENQPLVDANVSKELQRDMENQLFANLNTSEESHRDAENQSLADANVSEEVQRDAENQSIANENVSEEVQRDVESRSYFIDVTQWSVCHPSTSEFTPHVVIDFVKLWDKNDFADTNDLKRLHWDVDKQFFANATVLEEVPRCGEPIICRCKCIGTDGGESLIWRCKCIADADVSEFLTGENVCAS